MTLQVWGGAAALVAASLVIGQALALLGLRSRAAGPAVGMSALIVIAWVAIKLPGRAVTAAVVLVLVVLAAAAMVIRRRGESRPALAAVLVLPLAIAGAAIPFLANGRVGLLGVSLDNDTANHLVWAESLREPAVGTRYGNGGGYPLGPHSLADALASGLGLRLDLAFTSLLIATLLLTALVGVASLRDEAGWKRLLVGGLAALLYLPAAYYAEASFKETLLGMMLLAIVLHVEGLRRDWPARPRERWLALIPLSVLSAGALYTYSYPAIAWLVLTFGIWGLAEVVTHLGWLRDWRRRVRELVPPVGIAIAALVVLVLPTAGRIVSFAGSLGVSPSGSGVITTSNVGNLAGPLSPYEALGIWNQPDFRFNPVNLFQGGELAGLALALLVIGLLWSIRRRELILPAAVVACAVVYWRASHGQSPYISAKALVVAGPVVAATAGRTLLRTPVPRLSAWLAVGRAVVAAGFFLLAAHSSYLVLRSEPLWAPESTNELLTLDKQTRGQSLLFLGASDYADWIFKDSDMSALAPNSTSMAQALPRATKPNAYGTALDFDSVDPSSLNRFTWVILPDTSYASQPPTGFELVRRLRMYELWRRVSQVAPRRVIESSGAPGAVMNCSVPALRALSRRRGMASVEPSPAVAPVPPMAPGQTVAGVLRLPAGTWSLSLQYESPAPLDVSAPGHIWRMPAYDDRPGPFFAVGSFVSSGGPVTVTVSEARPSRLTGPNLISVPGHLAAVSSTGGRALVPLSRACGRYVDWYKLQ